jgi:hypothetical protein
MRLTKLSRARAKRDQDQAIEILGFLIQKTGRNRTDQVDRQVPASAGAA